MFQRSRDDKNSKSDRKCFRCGDPNHLIRECPIPPKDKNQKAFVEGSWSDSGEEDDEKVKDETCLVAHVLSEICLGVNLEPDEWIKDSGYSKHMTGNRKLFSTYKAYNGSNAIFGSNLRGNIIGKGKQAHASHKANNIVSMTRCLELLHMHLFVPSAIRSYGGNRYTLVIVDDYSSCSIVSITTNHYREFDNEVQFGEFCNANGITHNFSAPRTPQSNGVVERKNRTLQEMSRTMLNEQSLPQKFWCNAVDTSTYILNRILIRAILGKTPYELLRGRKPTLDYFRVFGSKCFILNTKDYLTKFDPKSYEGVFLGYSQNSKAYIILNKHTRKVEKSLNVTFDETPPPSKTSPLVDDDLDEEEAIKVTEKKNLENDIVDETLEIDEIVNIKESRNHPLENVIGNLNQRTLRSQAPKHTLDISLNEGTSLKSSFSILGEMTLDDELRYIIFIELRFNIGHMEVKEVVIDDIYVSQKISNKTRKVTTEGDKNSLVTEKAIGFQSDFGRITYMDKNSYGFFLEAQEQ
ncbi:retrovirus-related pol polyprotein from transposon TNT 1-94 [Tanacetum coccineum]